MATEKKQSRIIVVQGKLSTILAKAGITLTIYNLTSAQFRFYPDGWSDTLVYGGHVTGYEICEDIVRLYIVPVYVNGNREHCLSYYFGPDETSPAWKLSGERYCSLKKGILELFL